MSNTELIADLQSNIVGDPFPLMRKAADAIEALEAERDDLKLIAEHYRLERDALQAQLAAAQGQSPLLKKALDALEVAQDNLREHGDNCFLHDSGEYASCFCGKDSLSSYLQSVVEELAIAQDAAPIPQQVAEHSGCACRWDADYKRVATCVRHQGWLDVVSEWAGRAKAAESEQAQPPEPGEAAREYMTGYSDGREWAGATNQAQSSQALELVNTQRVCFIRGWDARGMFSGPESSEERDMRMRELLDAYYPHAAINTKGVV